MLARQFRLTKPAEYRSVFRQGTRANGHSMQLLTLSAPDGISRIGFLVSRQVGKAVTRNLVKRRLRAAAAELLKNQHSDSRPQWLVVRAFPSAATASFTELRQELIALHSKGATR